MHNSTIIYHHTTVYATIYIYYTVMYYHVAGELQVSPFVHI